MTVSSCNTTAASTCGAQNMLICASEWPIAEYHASELIAYFDMLFMRGWMRAKGGLT